MPIQNNKAFNTLNKRDFFVKDLARISYLLDKKGKKDERINKVLTIISKNISSEAISLYAIRYDTKEEFTLQCMGTYCASKIKIFESILSSAEFYLLLKNNIHKLQRNRLLKFKLKNDGLNIEHLNGYACPVFLKENFYGFLYIITKESIEYLRHKKQFIFAICSILSLWIGKLNIEDRLKTILNLMPSPAYGIDNEHKVSLWNKAMEKMTLRTKEEMIGGTHYLHGKVFYGYRRPTSCDLVLEPDPSWEQKYTAFLWKDEELYSSCFCPGLPDGGAFLTGKTTVVRDINQRAVGSIHIVRDVTRERRMEKDLEQSQQMYRTLTDFAGVGIALFGEKNIIYCNEKLKNLLGIKGNNITIKDILNRISKKDRDLLANYFCSLFNGSSEAIRVEVSSLDKTETIYYKIYAKLVYYHDIPAIHFILDDITTEKRLSEQARVTEMKMYHEDRLTALGVMAAGIAHELNQPLTAIKVISDGLLFGRERNWKIDQKTLFTKMEIISQQTTRMSQVIQNIKNFSREDNFDRLEKVDINNAIRNVFSMLGCQLEVHGIEVTFSLASNLPNIVTTRNHLDQIIMNLVVNARQALDMSNRKDRKLEVRSFEKPGLVAVEIIDNAGGVPQEIINKIFDPFFTTKEVGQGTGLGLSISQSIATKFFGRIEAFNNDKGGATFRLTAPIKG